MNTDVFAGTKIDPSALVQKLDPDTRSVASVRRGESVRLRSGCLQPWPQAGSDILMCGPGQVSANLYVFQRFFYPVEKF